MRALFNVFILSFALFNRQVPDGPKPRFVIPLENKNTSILNVFDGDGRCTGFSISPHLVLTCAHCVESGKPHLSNGASATVLYVGHPGGPDDFAILWSPVPAKVFAELTAEEPSLNAPLIDVSLNPGLFAYPLTYIVTHLDGSYIVNGRIRPGDSGSPVFNLDNQVIGIAFAYNRNTGEFGFVAPIYQVMQKMKELDIKLD